MEMESQNVENIRRCTGEKSHKCNQCDFESAWASALKKHLKIHSGERSFKCTQCDFASLGFVLDSTTYISPGRIIYLRRSSVVLEKVFLSKLPLLNCPKSGKCIFTTVSVVVQYFSVFHSEIALQTAVGLAPF